MARKRGIKKNYTKIQISQPQTQLSSPRHQKRINVERYAFGKLCFSKIRKLRFAWICTPLRPPRSQPKSHKTIFNFSCQTASNDTFVLLSVAVRKKCRKSLIKSTSILVKNLTIFGRWRLQNTLKVINIQISLKWKIL